MEMLDQKMSCLSKLAGELATCSSLEDRLIILNSFLGGVGEVEDLSLEHAYLVRALEALGQAERLLGKGFRKEEVIPLLDSIAIVEKFYASIGGIVGYQYRMLQLLSTDPKGEHASSTRYYPPEGIDIAEETKEVRGFVWQGLEHMGVLAEIYPVGGAADRLGLRDERTGAPLPAAKLPFLGKTLLEGLMGDLQAREYLYYKLFGKEMITPVALMTSAEKDNYQHILAICEELNWFGRPRNSFRLFCQPLVPTVNKQGEWCLQKEGQLLLKPGGHGVIWRLALEEGIFEWFAAQGRTKALVRQINNPVAGTDYGLLAFTGVGIAENKVFGFASCPRQVRASEGINVLVERQKESGYEYTLTNIEYCDFKRFGIVDQPAMPGSAYSKFSSNTNILFADLKAVAEAAERCPIPGTLVNLKKTAYTGIEGEKKEEEIARLESMMQNIADFFTDEFHLPLQKGERRELKTYLTYNTRLKTISTAKRAFSLGASLLETPEGCYLDILRNSQDLLRRCGFKTPDVNDLPSFSAQGPSFIFLYHPGLGPLYSVIAQKLRKGNLQEQSELQLQIADIDLENLTLQGSLQVQAEAVLGHLSGGLLSYSPRCGKCTLKNVSVRNRGIDVEMPNVYWKNEIARQESCHIILRGFSEFYAENVTLTGDHFIEVEDGFRVEARQEGTEVVFIRTPLEKSWTWRYSRGEDNRIVLEKEEIPLEG